MPGIEPRTSKGPAPDGSLIAAGVAACIECEQACIACADACLAEPEVAALRRCIRSNQDCADICGATARVASRFAESNDAVLGAQLEACALACATCVAECRVHARHEFCQLCADTCQRCEEQCRNIVRALGTSATRRS
jgi:hypothetical protein